MNPADIGKAYDEIAHLWQDEQFNASNGIEQHERALSFLSDKGWALDVGCGCNSRLHHLLESHGLQVEGIDVSAKMLEIARVNEPSVTFHLADICEWTPPRQYAFISGWDSIWHIPLNQQSSVLTKLMNALQPGGVFILSMGGAEQPQEIRNTHMGPEVYYSTPGINALMKLIEDADCQLRHLEYDQWPEVHLSVIIQRGEG